MSKTKDIEELLARAYGPRQSELSDDEAAQLMALGATPVVGQRRVPPGTLPRILRMRLWGVAAIAAALLAGAAGYAVGSMQNENSTTDATLPAVLVPLSDGSSRDTRDAKCEAQMDVQDASITGMTCSWSDGATLAFTAAGKP